METFELYKSGVSRTIRLKAWAIGSKSGKLRVSECSGCAVVYPKLADAEMARRDTEQIFYVEVTIKATKKTG